MGGIKDDVLMGTRKRCQFTSKEVVFNRCPELSNTLTPFTCQTRLVFQSNSTRHLCSKRSILQGIDEEEEIEKKNGYNQ